jgi:hypothetical protein
MKSSNISLAPLKYKDAVSALLKVKPEPKKIRQKPQGNKK